MDSALGSGCQDVILRRADPRRIKFCCPRVFTTFNESGSSATIRCQEVHNLLSIFLLVGKSPYHEDKREKSWNNFPGLKVIGPI